MKLKMIAAAAIVASLSGCAAMDAKIKADVDAFVTNARAVCASKGSLQGIPEQQMKDFIFVCVNEKIDDQYFQKARRSNCSTYTDSSIGISQTTCR